MELHTIKIQGEPLDAPDGDLKVSDYFGIRKVSKLTYEIDLFVVGDYGHVCQITGLVQGIKNGPSQIFRLLPDEQSKAMQANGEKSCDLQIKVTPSLIKIVANSACNSQFVCGVRAGVYDRQFKRGSKLGVKSKALCFRGAANG